MSLGRFALAESNQLGEQPTGVQGIGQKVLQQRQREKQHPHEAPMVQKSRPSLRCTTLTVPQSAALHRAAGSFKPKSQSSRSPAFMFFSMEPCSLGSLPQSEPLQDSSESEPASNSEEDDEEGSAESEDREA